MCMIAGYIGSTEAAPHLIEMIRLQEFIFGGFYSGIGTFKDGVLHRRRSVGAISSFVREHAVSELPRSIGIAHSRTNDGGGIEWAQPRFDASEELACVGVGIGGIFSSSSQTDRILALADSLLKEGVTFRTRVAGNKKNGLKLPNGDVVHGGDVFLHGVARLYRQGHSIVNSIRTIKLPSESVSLFLSSKEPDKLFVANHNSRLLVVKTDSGTRLVSSLLAITERPDWIVEIPSNTFAVVTGDSVNLEVLWENEDRFDFTTSSTFSSKVLEYIKQNPGATWWETVTNAIAPTLPQDKANMSFALGLSILENLVRETTLRYEIKDVAGVEGQFPVPQMILFCN